MPATPRRSTASSPARSPSSARDQGVEVVADVVEQDPRRAAALPVMIWRHSAGSPAAIRVTSRTPCPDSARCAGGDVGQLAGRRARPSGAAGATCGPPPGRARSGVIRTTAAPHAAASASTVATAAGSDVACGVTAQGRPSKSAALAGQRTGALAARHRVAADVAGERRGVDGRGHLRQRLPLHAADVGDHGAAVASAVATIAADRGRRHRDHDQGGRPGRPARGTPAPRPAAVRTWSSCDVAEPDLDPRRVAAPARSTCRAGPAPTTWTGPTDQLRAANRAKRAMPGAGSPDRTRVRSLRSVAAP